MRVRCLTNEPSRLADHQRTRVAQYESNYPLSAGRVYPVLGMSIWETVLEFLVRDDNGDPCFAAAGFFEPTTAQIPAHWKFALRKGVHASGTHLWTAEGVAIWGYPDLVDDQGHAGALEEGEGAALETFAREHEVVAQVAAPGSAVRNPTTLWDVPALASTPCRVQD